MTIAQTAAENAAYSNRISTMINLPLAANTTTPVPASVATYYATNLATGTGPNGTFLVTDFFGSAAGIPYNTVLANVTATLTAQSSNLSALKTIYSQMASVVTSAYGTPPTVVIPSGPAAGTYTTYDAALAALVTAARSAISTAITAMGTTVTGSLNSDWLSMVTHSVNEPVNQTKASINYSNLTAGAQLPITAFIPTLGDLGKQTQTGMAAQFLESIANTANQYGQAMVGALREGRNTSGLNSVGINPVNAVPSASANLLPQATLITSEYTVAQARAQV